MPQVYASIHATSKMSYLIHDSQTNAIARTDADWTAQQNLWAASAVKPIVPVAYGATPVTPDELIEFANALKNDPSPATAGGYGGVSFYDADNHTADIWNAIGTVTIGKSDTSTQTYALSAGCLDGISFPFTPTAGGSSLFSDVLGSIQQDCLPYVFYMDNYGDFQFSSYSGMAAAAKTGYLLFLTSPASFTASGDAVDAGITLHSGWNYVGVTSDVTPAQNAHVYSQAYALVGGTLQACSIFQQGMSPGVAYFIYSFTDANVLIPNGAGASMVPAGSALDSDAGGISASAVPAANGTIGDNFQAGLTTTQNISGGGSLTVDLTFGVQPGATDGYDPAFDQLAPPTLPGSSAAYFNEQQRLSVDDKAAGDVKEWPLTVVSQTQSLKI
jgi:hypothetical protein